MALPEMTAGGEWLRGSSDGHPVYVVGEDSIQRCLRSGWVIVADPRIIPETPAGSEHTIPQESETVEYE